MGSLYLKNRIPDGSKLCISIVEGPTTPQGSFVASARLVLEDGSEEIWDDSQVHPGPKCKKLRSPEGYVWRVRIAFTSAATQTAIINATITKPDGTVFGKPYAEPVSGRNGDIARATIMAITQQQ
ncbi:MAG TPA: hypothetical protein VGN07_10230 [Steroidobacteraceae bacterium]|jgi:hypothetical protein